MARSTWTTQTPLEVTVASQDRFGNPAVLAGVATLLAGVGHTLYLRSNASKSIQISPHNGLMQLDGRSGEGHVSLSCSEVGIVEIWLEQAGGNSTRDSRKLLRERTLRRLEFVRPAVPPEMPSAGSQALSLADRKWQPMSEEVRDAFLHAWRGYRKYAWGKDELQPLSKSGRDSFGGIGMTILDSLTTLWLMGLRTEFDEATKFVEDSLDFDNADSEVSVFELIIRALGGLLGAHALSGRRVFLVRAKELAERLLPALNTSSRLPMPKWNIARGVGSPSTEPTILSEAGSMQLELRYLTEHIGDTRFQRAGDACLEAIQQTGVTGLAPVYLTPPDHSPPRALASKFALGALADSYYEYLLKLWLQNPREVRFKELWLAVLDEIPGLLRPRPPGPRALEKLKSGAEQGPKFKLVEVAPGGESIWKMDHLSCFAPAMIALGLKSLPSSDLREKSRNATWWPVADGLTASCMELWTSSRSGLAPEFSTVKATAPFDFHEVPEQGHHSFLRPETAESLFYLYRFTGDEKYREYGKVMFRAIDKNGKVDAGYASVKDVKQEPTEKLDEMQSFVMAETFKYLYLLFSPAHVLDLDRYVLNTEGHPLRKFGRS
jgi:mannosyl-oligosaccharide alpha-1,2-mannosidase